MGQLLVHLLGSPSLLIKAASLETKLEEDGGDGGCGSDDGDG